jgi:hypothetical protein
VYWGNIPALNNNKQKERGMISRDRWGDRRSKIEDRK